MDVATYLSLGITGLSLVAIIVLSFAYKSKSDRCDDLADKEMALTTDNAQKTLDAERARFDLAQCQKALADATARVDALTKLVASEPKDAALPPDDLADRVARVSATGAGLSRAGTSPGTGIAVAVPGPTKT